MSQSLVSGLMTAITYMYVNSGPSLEAFGMPPVLMKLAPNVPTYV
jgi:hypothetical protein